MLVRQLMLQCRSTALVLLAITVLFCGCSSPSTPRDGKVGVRFIVTTPKDTAVTDTIYICGSEPEVGTWNGKGVALQRRSNGEHEGTVRLTKGGKLEYKVTRGSWETVEKAADGADIANRTLALDKDQVVKVDVASWVPSKPKLPTASGDIRYHKEFHSKILNNDRSVIVWLPPGYEKDTSARYPVLYMHDGQNLFDDATSFAGEWRADETARRLIEEGKIVPIIIVGIENAGAARMDEYTPTTEPIYVADKKAIDEGKKTKADVETEGGKGELYAQFLITEVKPFIDQTYRTQADRAHTAVAGSSLGGLISLYMAWKHHDVFSKFGVISPSLWWDNRDLTKHLYVDHDWMKTCKIWFDMGTDEGAGQYSERNMLATRELAGIFSRARLSEDVAYRYREIDKAKHNEQAWAERFDQVLLFLFGK
ncbi:MAG: hypothetical protein H7Z14_13305 [Anaerolineae bacterium]|nr:hypothetical protein [Phycisphaerae bacterium]